MKTNLDALMQEHNLDALLIVGAGQHNPPMVYLTGGAHLTNAILIKKRGTEPILFHTSMERDEAAKTQLETRNLDNYRLDEILKQTNGNWIKALVERYRRIFDDISLFDGRIAIYGWQDVGEYFAIFSALQAELPNLIFVGEYPDTLLASCMMTKNFSEVERIRQMGKITTTIVGRVADFLTAHRVKENILMKPDGNPLTIGDVKKQINLWVAENGAETPEGVIFSLGRDAGIPHSVGRDSEWIQTGKTIIFDIFPCEMGGGYFYDFTRSWCLGYAPDETIALYEDVLAVYNQILNSLRLNGRCREYQQLTCELFKARGHQTLQDNPHTQEGFVHSLGHGVGLHVHEQPFFRLTASEAEVLEPGATFTIEPGLYYPEREMGIRLEDTLWARPDGQFEVLAPYPLDLILPMP